MSDSLPSDAPLRIFEAAGMNTLFYVRIHEHDYERSDCLAGNCFIQLEELENQLSRYLDESEVSLINQLKTGESLLLSDSTYRCLMRSFEASAATAGLFDVTLGRRTWQQDQNEESVLSKGKLALAPDRPQIICEEEGREIDFGGIGKGFALDQMAETLSELGVQSALLSAGSSTHLALGDHPWPFNLTGEKESKDITVTGQAMSASGLGIQGAHVIHPDIGTPPDYHFQMVWVITDSAALADAFSTACMLMDPQEIQTFADVHKSDLKIYVEQLPDFSIRQIVPR